MSEKQEVLEGVYGAVLQGPRNMVKAKLLEPQSPVVQTNAHRYNAYNSMPLGANRLKPAIRNLHLTDDEE